MENELNNILANIVRIGTVSAIDATKRKARVIFKGKDDMVSGWLCVLQHPGANVNVGAGGGHTHAISDTFSGGGSASDAPNHSHTGSNVTYWMPQVNDTVLAVYLPIFNADGFILGVI